MLGGKPEDYICLHKIKWWMNRTHIENFVSKFGKLIDLDFVPDDGNKYDRKVYIRFRLKSHITRLRSAIEALTFNDEQPSFEILALYPNFPKQESTAVKELLQGQKAPKFFEDPSCIVPFCPEDFIANVRPFYKTGVKPLSKKSTDETEISREDNLEFIDRRHSPEITPSGNGIQPLAEDQSQRLPQQKSQITLMQAQMPAQPAQMMSAMSQVVGPSVVMPSTMIAGSYLPQSLMMQQPLMTQMMMPQPVQIVSEPPAVRRPPPPPPHETPLRTIPRITDLSDPMLPPSRPPPMRSKPMMEREMNPIPPWAGREEFVRRDRDPMRGEFVRERFRDRRRDDPREYDPREYDHREYDPRDCDPRDFGPRDFDSRGSRNMREPRDFDVRDERDYPREHPRDYRKLWIPRENRREPERIPWEPTDLRDPRLPQDDRDIRPQRRTSPPRRDPGYFDRRRGDEFVRRNWR